MLKKLEDILNSVTMAETKAVNFFFTSDFAMEHSAVSSATFGVATTAAFSAVMYDFGIYITPLLSFLWAITGISNYIYIRPRTVLYKNRVNIKAFDKLDRQPAAEPVNDSRFPRNIIDTILTHPRSAAAFGVGISLAYVSYNTFLEYSRYSEYSRLLEYSGLDNLPAFKHPIILFNEFVAMPSFIYFTLRGIISKSKRFLHSKAPKAHSKLIFAYIASFAADKLKIKPSGQFMARAIEDELRQNQADAVLRFDLGEAYFKSGRNLEALIEMRRALDEWKEPEMVLGFDSIFGAASHLNIISKRMAQPSDYIRLVMILSQVGEREKAMHFFDEYESKFPGIHNDINRALLLQTIKETERAQLFWRRALDGIYSQESLRILPTGEGVHFSGRFDADEMLASTLFVKRVFQREADYEARLISEVNGRNSNPAYNVPQVVGSVPYGSNVDLVLRYIKGVTLASMGHDAVAYGKTIDSLSFTSWFHRNVSPELSEVGVIDMQRKFSKIVGRLGFNGNAVPFLDAVGSVIDDLEANDLHVLAKDGHPYQFIISSDSIAPVDYDDKGVDLLSRDVAKALVHPDLPVSKDRLPQLVSDAARVYRDEGMVDDMQRQELLFLKGMLLQPLSYCDAWSVPELVKMSGRRGAAIERAFVALDVLRQSHGDDFAFNSINYARIRDGYMRLDESLLKVHAS